MQQSILHPQQQRSTHACHRYVTNKKMLLNRGDQEQELERKEGTISQDLQDVACLIACIRKQFDICSILHH